MRFERREGRTNRNKRAAGVASTYLYVDPSRRIARVLRGINVFGKKKENKSSRGSFAGEINFRLRSSLVSSRRVHLDELSPTTLIVPRSRSYTRSTRGFYLTANSLPCSENKEKFFLQMIWIRILSSYCKCSS